MSVLIRRTNNGLVIDFAAMPVYGFMRLRQLRNKKDFVNDGSVEEEKFPNSFSEELTLTAEYLLKNIPCPASSTGLNDDFTVTLTLEDGRWLGLAEYMIRKILVDDADLTVMGGVSDISFAL